MSGLFGSPILDVAIGLFFIYLLLSLLCSNVNELMAVVMKTRAHQLRQGIQNLLCDPVLADKVLNHQLIKGLGNTNAESFFIEILAGIKDRAGLPSYIPAHTFAMALFDRLAPTTNGPLDSTRIVDGASALAYPANELKQAASYLPDPTKATVLDLIDQKALPDQIAAAIPDVGLKTALNDFVTRNSANKDLLKQAVSYLPMLNGTKKKLEKALDRNKRLDKSIEAISSADLEAALGKFITGRQAISQAILSLINSDNADLKLSFDAIETWYDNAMDQVSKLYKRQAQVWLFVIALFLSGFLGADTLRLISTLSTNATLRAFTVAEAGKAIGPGGTIAMPTSSGTLTTTVTTTNAAKVVTTTQVANALDQFHVLFGWDDLLSGWLGWKWLLWRLLGLVVTAFAVSLGAPFWFDLLGRLIPPSTSDPKQAKSA